jgi:hypothetical protein
VNCCSGRSKSILRDAVAKFGGILEVHFIPEKIIEGTGEWAFKDEERNVIGWVNEIGRRSPGSYFKYLVGVSISDPESTAREMGLETDVLTGGATAAGPATFLEQEILLASDLAVRNEGTFLIENRELLTATLPEEIKFIAESMKRKAAPKQ